MVLKGQGDRELEGGSFEISKEGGTPMCIEIVGASI